MINGNIKDFFFFPQVLSYDFNNNKLQTAAAILPSPPRSWSMLRTKTSIITQKVRLSKAKTGGFRGCSVVKNSPANSGATGSVAGNGTPSRARDWALV